MCVAWYKILLLAGGLSMDALAIAIASGCAMHSLRHAYALRIATAFGFFQAFMPILGWLAGMRLCAWMGAWCHWLAFALLTVVGLKMLWEARGLRQNPTGCGVEMGLLMLLTLALVTSVDALAVGMSLSFLGMAIMAPACMIGVVTFGLSLAGVWLGNRSGHWFEIRLEALGGIVLLLMGGKVLLDHLLGRCAVPCF